MLVTNFWTILRNATQAKWTGVYLRILACILFYGATIHVSNMLGLSGRPWLETPLLWRTLDVVLLGFDVAVGIGLWRREAWAVVGAIVGILLLQIFPYTAFHSQFIQTPADAQALNGLIGTEVLLLAILIGLIGLQKCKFSPPQ